MKVGLAIVRCLQACDISQLWSGLNSRLSNSAKRDLCGNTIDDSQHRLRQPLTVAPELHARRTTVDQPVFMAE